MHDSITGRILYLLSNLSYNLYARRMCIMEEIEMNKPVIHAYLCPPFD